MRIVPRLLLRRLAGLRTMVRNREGAKLAVAALFVLLFVLVMVGEYLMFRQGMVEVLNIGAPSAALTLYILEAFLVLVLVIAVVSFVATGLWTFYRGRDTAFLLATPLPLGHLFWLRAAETFLVTSWALVVLAVPAFLALGAAHGVPPLFYLWALVILVLFMALAGALGTFLTPLAGAVFRRYRPRSSIALATAVLVGAFALLVGRSVVPSAGDFYLIFDPGIPNGKPASIKFIEHRFAYWPSHPLAVSLYAGIRETPAGSDALAVAAWLGPALALLAAGIMGRPLFARTVRAAVEGLDAPGRTPRRRAATFPRLLRGPVGAIVERDLVGLARSPHELGQAAFIVFLLALYTAILALAPLGDALSRPDVVARLFFLDLLAIGYFVTAIGIRFAFPSLSLEGRGAWILFTSPLSLRGLLAGRLLAYSSLLLLVVGPLAAAGALRLVTEPALVGAFTALLALVIVSTVAVCLAFGALWPDFSEASAERVATSGGGLATIACCLGYVAVMGWLGHRSVLAAADGRSVLPSLAIAVALSVTLVAGAAAAAWRRLRTLEIL